MLFLCCAAALQVAVSSSVLAASGDATFLPNDCSGLPDGTPCDDRYHCTFGDVCSGGYCHGTPASCNDNLPCTYEFCDPIEPQCIYRSVPGCVSCSGNPGSACDDLNPCTTADVCSDLLCSGAPIVPAPWKIDTVAGNGTRELSGDHGPARSAGLNEPHGVTVAPAGSLYIADFNNNRVRKVDTAGIITTIAGGGSSGDGGPATSARLNGAAAVAFDNSGNLYIADYFSHRIRKVNPSGTITTVAGNGTAGYSGDGGAATAAQLDQPHGIAIDALGNIYISERVNNCIRKIDGSGIITYVAGRGSAGLGDHGPATSATLEHPHGIAVDGEGNVYVADYHNNRIRKIDIGGTITTVAGNGTWGNSGDGGPATEAALSRPRAVAVDSLGNMYIVASGLVRRVDKASGKIATVAGNGTWAYSGDGGPATEAGISDAYGVALGASGKLYVADTYNNRIRMVKRPILCTEQPPGSSCDDGDPCTANDVCNASCGVCAGVPTSVDDGNLCTVDACDSATGNAVHVAILGDDNNSCTIDSCDVNIGIIHTPAPDGSWCDDGNVCTVNDTCTNAQCSGAPVTARTPCDDGQRCTTSDACSAGQCVGSPDNSACANGNACMTGSCDELLGCVYAAIDCDDHNPCTIDSCDPVIGCRNTPPPDIEGWCVIGGTYRCFAETNHDNACQWCMPAVNSTEWTAKPDGTACDDGLLCTVTDTCSGGMCGSADPAPTGACTQDNNLTLVDPDETTYGGTNDVFFDWDGTLKTAVVPSGQAPNARVSSPCALDGAPWTVHDAAVYGPGTYEINPCCPAGSPGCSATCNDPHTGDPIGRIQFTVNQGQRGFHALLDWGSSADIDVVNVWTIRATDSIWDVKGVFEPSNLWTGACGSNPPEKIWDFVSSDSGGINGMPMVEGPFEGKYVSFNVMADLVIASRYSLDNNFTLLFSNGFPIGGTNDVGFTWDFTRKKSVATAGQVANATISSSCTLFGAPWSVHDVAIYGPGTYTVYSGCPAGSPGCGSGSPITFAVGSRMLGCHMLVDWNGETNIDFVNVWEPRAQLHPSTPWTGGCGSNPADTLWGLMSRDFRNQGINGAPIVEGVLAGMRPNFNLFDADLYCSDAATRCDDGNRCTYDWCDAATGACIHDDIMIVPPPPGPGPICSDGNACTGDSCDPALGCVHTPVSCDDGNVCTSESCDPASGCAYLPADGNPCDDGEYATCGDACVGGACFGHFVEQPEEVGDGAVSFEADKETIVWADVSGTYNVYRGSNGHGAAPWEYDQTCLAANVTGTAASDANVPPAGAFFYYLVSRASECRESNLGHDSIGTPTPNDHPCATGGAR